MGELLRLIRYSLPLQVVFGLVLVLYVLTVVSAYATLDADWLCYYRSSLSTDYGRHITLNFLKDWDSYVRAMAILAYYPLQATIFLMFCVVWLGFTRGYLVLLWSFSASIWLLLVCNYLLAEIIAMQDLYFNSMAFGTGSTWCPWPGRIGPGIVVITQIYAATRASKDLPTSQWVWGSAAASSILAFLVLAVIQGILIKDWLPFLQILYPDQSLY